MPQKGERDAPGKRGSTWSGDAIRRFFRQDGIQVADDAVRLIKDECEDAAQRNPRTSRDRWEGVMSAAGEITRADGRHRVQKRDVRAAESAFQAGINYARRRKY